jgi:tetratricopeptide (TPR) repeat protein
MDRTGAIDALRRAQSLEPSVEALLDLALALALAGDLGGEVSACEQAVELDGESLPAWTRLAHALARTELIVECLDACERALELGGGSEVADLLERMRSAEPRVLPAA